MSTATVPTVMKDAAVSMSDGDVIITNVHHASGEGFTLVIRANGFAYLDDHYYDTDASQVVVERTLFASPAEAVTRLAEVAA